jgi:hypothetical protein
MTEIVFQPYVGPTYRTTAVRVLILGESHYGEPHFDPAEATRHVVRMWLDREWPIRYLTVAARLLTGLEAWQIDRCHAFSAVAFYNFIQMMMADISVRPTPAQAAVSCGAFREILTSLDPTHVLATGQRFLWDNMPTSDEAAPEVLLGGVVLPYREYQTPSGVAMVIAIPHLSRASANQWRPPVAEFLRLSPLIRV